jgi:restriction endonuclease S subunit
MSLLPIPVPPINEQYRIVSKVKAIMSLINQMENKLKSKIDLVEKMVIV